MSIASTITPWVRRALDPNNWAGLAESLFICGSGQCERPQLFILGLPRSGTTLVYQYFVHRLDVAHFTNGVGKYYKAPCLTSYLQRRKHGVYISDFKSSYGRVSNPLGPREAGSFWGRFFGLEDYIPAGAVPERSAKQLRKAIHCVQRIFGNVPFVNKNVKHLLRVPALAEVFPNARFLVVERNIKNVALSVYRARMKQTSGLEAWWSVKPPRYEEIQNLPTVAEQVAAQLRSLQEQMHADTALLKQDHVCWIRYEDFCKTPELSIASVRDLLGDCGFRNDLVEGFNESNNEPLTDGESELISLVEKSSWL